MAFLSDGSKITGLVGDQRCSRTVLPMKHESPSALEGVDIDFVPESYDVVVRKDIKPSRRSWFGELRSITFMSKLSILVFSTLGLGSLVLLSLLLYFVDILSLEILRTFAGSSGYLTNSVVIGILSASCYTIWISLRKPPPGGAGVLLGGNDEATWQTSTNFFFPFLALGIIMTICAFLWYLG